MKSSPFLSESRRSTMQDHPAFGSADLTNCERELIHLAGSVQPHGVLVVLHEDDLTIVQASANTNEVLGISVSDVIGRRLAAFGGNLAREIEPLVGSTRFDAPIAIRAAMEVRGAPVAVAALVHRHPGGGIIVEIEPADSVEPDRADVTEESLAQRLTWAVKSFGSATSITDLCDDVVRTLRQLAGYDRVMVYKFDRDGHGEVVAEARETRLEAFIGRHYPASDIPQRARELYLRNRVRVLVDVDYEPVPLEPRLSPITGADVDMSLSYLRSMSPLHLQYLRNMGVTATLVASLVREGQLWGLIACHHYSPKGVRFELRAAIELLADVISTRISALENYAEAQAEVLVRRLEHRIIEATTLGGDWRPALFDNPRTLLQPLDATGAALYYDGEILTAGDVPSTPEIRALLAWISQRDSDDTLFACSSVARANPELGGVTPTASGVLAVEMSRGGGEYLVWFREEQIKNVTWGGDPRKPVVMGNDPLELSPRRSFAAWHELVRGTAKPWSPGEHAIARAIGTSLADIVLQIRAVRVLIAETHLARMRHAVQLSSEPVIIADSDGAILLENDALSRILRRPHRPLERLEELPVYFDDPDQIRLALREMFAKREPWRGDSYLTVGGGERIPVAIRADVVPGHGGILGFILIITDMTARREAEVARQRLQHAIFHSQQPGALLGETALQAVSQDYRDLIAAIWANASVAVMEIADAATVSSVAPLLKDVEFTTRHAADLTRQLLNYSSRE